MADQQTQLQTLNNLSSSNNITNHHEHEESESHMQSETTTSTTQLLERNVKQIQIKEESTVKKILKTREIRHFNALGEQISPTETNENLPNSNSTENFIITKQATEKKFMHSPSNHGENIQHQPSLNQIGETHPINQQSGLEPISVHQDHLQQHHQQQQESFYDSNFNNHHESNYRNLLPPSNSANLNGFLTNQHDSQLHNNLHQQQQQQSPDQPQVQPMQRTTSRISNSILPSGYEELDSTLNYNSAPQSIRMLINDPNANVGYLDKANSIQVANSNQVILQDPLLSQNGVVYVNNKSTYDMAYGTTGPQQTAAQVPMISTNSGIYGTRTNPEPVYAICRRRNMNQINQSNNNNLPNNGSEIRWRDPELEEVISFLSSSDPMIRANSVAYLQHLSFADDQVKQKTRHLGGIQILIDLLNRDTLEVQRNVCGALRNLSYGRKNDDNKRAIRDASGIQSLVRTLINNPDNEIRELATSVLWNLSSCEDVKWAIIDEALTAIVSVILVPYTAWFKANLSNAQQFLPTANETHWSTVFRNATGVLRNVSSAGAHARKQLRDCEGLIESLFFIINTSISRNDVENKLVENCVCILRNLSCRCQETQDPDYDKHYYSNNNSHTDSNTNSIQNSPSSPSSSANLTTSLVGQVSSRVTNNLGCFSFSRRSKSKSKSSFLSSSRNNSNHNLTNQLQGDQSISMTNDIRSATLLPPHHSSNLNANGQQHSSTMVRTSTQLDGFNNSSATLPRSGLSSIANNGVQSQPFGKELLWQPEVVKPYLSLLSGCSNSETLEAAAGAIQNLAACNWKPSIDIRAAVRKERGLPVLVELLRMDRDRVVCVVATALRNLAIDQKNKELIGKYAMPDLVNKLTTGQNDQDSQTSDDTVAAVLATLHEVISNNADFVRSLYDSGGLNKLTYIIRNRNKFSVRVQRFAAQVLLDMWKFTELRDMYKKGGWKESHFIVRLQNGKTST